MKKRLEKVFLKAMRHSAIAGILVLLLFACMAYSLWYLMDHNKVLTKFVVIGKFVFDQQVNVEPSTSYNKDKERIAHLILYDDGNLQKHLKPDDKINIVLSSLGKEHTVKAAITNLNEVNGQTSNRLSRLRIRILAAEDIGRQHLNQALSDSNYQQMEIYVRTKKLWRAAIERNG